MDNQTALTTTDNKRALSSDQITILRAMGGAANRVAAANVFESFQMEKADNTNRRHRADIALFAKYLNSAADSGNVALALDAEALYTTPGAWAVITHGLVDGFKGWQIQQGYSIASINARLSTVRLYAGLAFKAGALDDKEHMLIHMVKGYSRKAGLNVDDQREVKRTGNKKAQHVTLTAAQRRHLKSAPDMTTGGGRRDKLLVCLLLDHGLRCGELAALQVTDIDLKTGSMTFYRQKVDKSTTHTLSRDTLAALRAYANAGDMPAAGALLRSSTKGGKLAHVGMSERAVTKRVNHLGKLAGIVGLSAHDLRHSWATKYANERRGDTFGLQEAGGWASLAMPRRYVETAKIAYDGGLTDD